MKKNYLGLLIALIVIGLLIYWIEGTKANHGGGGPVEFVTPRTELTASTTEVQSSTTPITNSNQTPPQYLTPKQKASKYTLAREITTPDGFINTNGKSVKLADYVGKKVILLDIWTYSCINCQRTIPYLNAWYEKYQDAGLIIIGLQTPEFEFEKNIDNVQKAVEKFGIKYPVVLDNDFSTWNAYGNSYWPRKYLIDIDGYVVYDHIGEGDDEKTETVIQNLLKERAAVLHTNEVVPTGFVQPKTVGSVEAGSPETYFGSARNEYLGNGTRGVAGVQTFVFPSTISLNTLYLSGSWNMVSEYAESDSINAAIKYNYSAKNVYLVASSKLGTTLEITRDGQPLGAEAGADVVTKDGHSRVTIKDSRLYSLITEKAKENHIIEIRVIDNPLEAFTFTFG